MTAPYKSWMMRVHERGSEYSNPDFGELVIGIRPDGNEGWTFHERQGGGQVIVPFAYIQQKLFIGLLQEKRELQEGMVLNVPRGFSDGTLPWINAMREESEEVGFIYASNRIHQLPGECGNPNSAFFLTNKGEGVKFFAFMVAEKELEEVGEVWSMKPAYQIKRNLLLPVSDERIYGLRFFKWQVAAQVGDMFSNAAVARLLAATKG